MAATSDKARFYLESYVPTLQEWERKEIFNRDEIRQITTKRSAFEQLINSRSATPQEFAKYAEYELNLSTLVKKRCKRLGIKGTKGYTGQRTVFFILERGTRKFPGNLSLWMQYIRFCQQEKANKKLAKVLTQCLRLRPTEWGIWVLAAKWYAEEQGDMQTARSYMQRSLRFCKERRELWVEYMKLEMVYLAKLAARRKILGLDEERKEDVGGEEDENVIALPVVTAADLEPDASKGIEEVDAAALQRLAKAPAFSGAIPIAIFDAAMKKFEGIADVAEVLFELVATFEGVPAATKILQHILLHLHATAPQSPEANICETRSSLLGLDASSADFPPALGTALSRLKTGLAAVSDNHKSVLAEKAVLLLLPYLDSRDELDEDIRTVLTMSVKRYLQLARTSPTSRVVRSLLERSRTAGKLGAEDMVEVYRKAKLQKSPVQNG